MIGTLNLYLRKFILNLHIVLIIFFIVVSINLFILNTFFEINFKNIFLLLAIGTMGGIAETFYVESQIKRNNFLVIFAFIFLILSSCMFFIYLGVDLVLVKDNVDVLLMVICALCEGGLWVGIIIFGYIGILFIYIKLVRKDILNHDFKLLPYSVIYG